MIKNKVMKLMELAFEVSENTNTDVFVRYSPHCSLINITIYDDGWSASELLDYEPNCNINVYLNEMQYRNIENITTDLDDVINRLTDLLPAGVTNE